MNVLFLHCASDLYGASRCLLRFVERFQSEGHTAVIVMPEDGPLRERLVDAGGEVILDSMMPVLRRPVFCSVRGIVGFARRYQRAVPRYARLIRERKIDLVHTNSAVVLGGGAAAARTRIPHITHVRETFGEFGPLWAPYRSYLLRRSARIICVSKAMTEQFGSSRASARIVTHVYDGFDLSEFDRVDEAAVVQMRERYGLTAAGLTIVGLVGRIKWLRKGQETFIRAAARLVGNDPSLRFVMVGGVFPGNESHLDRTRELIAELGVGEQVLYLGEESNIYPVMKMFDVAVMASGLPEPFGGVTIEAMALGLPVVGTAIGGTPEQIEDGVTGVLVPPSDPAAMATAIARLLADRACCLRMGLAGRDRVARCFGFETHYERMMAEYSRLRGHD